MFVSILLFPSIFSFPSIVNADEGESEEESGNSCGTAFKDNAVDEKIEEFREDKATILEGFALDLFEMIMNTVNINTLEQLIFGNPFCIWFDGWGEPEMAFGLFPQKVYDSIVKPGFLLLTSIFVICFCLAIMIVGLKMGVSGTGLIKVNIGEEFYMFFLTIVTMLVYWFGVELLFEINYAIVSGLKELIVKQGVNTSSFSVVATADEFNFSDILLLFAEWVLVLFLNVVYMMRLFLITMLMMVGGLVIVGLLFKSTRKIFPKWLLDFTGAIFMQSVHALYFTAVILFVSIGNLSFLFKLTLLILFLPLGSMLLNMMGFSAATMSVSATQKGVAAISTAARIKGMSKKALPKGKLPGGDFTTGNTKISALATGANSNGWGNLKNAAGIGGAFAGATAGLVIGGHGASLGASVGASMATALQAPRNVIVGAKGILDTRKKIANNELNMSNIMDKRQAYGAYGESIGAMFGKGAAGRALGERFSGISQTMLMNSTELGGLGGVTLSDLATKYPDSKVLFEQTNEGSAFYLNNGESKQQISPFGLADSSLPDGMTRTIEYSPTSPHGPQTGDASIYSMSSAPALHDNSSGVSIADTNFNADYFKPENHVNMGIVPNSVQDLNQSTPFERGRGSE